jgi:lipopolysaccharide heptosyltransferase I
VLIIRPSALGDVARSVPVLASLRAAWPQAQIDWLVQDGFADVIRHHPALNGVVLFPRAHLGRFWCSGTAAREAWAWAADLRARGYDLTLDIQGLFRSGLFSWLTHAPQRIGYSGGAGAREFAWLGYHRRHAVPRSMHAVNRMLALVEAEGVPICRDMRLYVGSQEQQWLDGFLADNGLEGRAFAAIAPTARWLCKCWPIDRYIEVARRLLDSGLAGGRIVVLAAPGERAYIQPLLKAFGADQEAADDRPASKRPLIWPTTSIGQMMALISRATLLLCNDSAAQHLGVAFARPLVAIFGPTDPALEGPYGRLDSVVRPAGVEKLGRIRHRRRGQRNDQALIAQVAVEAVWEKIVEQMLRSDQVAERPSDRGRA